MGAGPGHPHGHGHGPARLRAGVRHRHRLAWALALLAGFFVVEAVGGLLTGSLALLSDAGHMLTDVLGLAMALAAISLASRAPANPQRSFGLYRVEILAALANAVLLLGIAGFLLWEAATRLSDPHDVDSLPMLVVAVGGLVVNLVALGLLREGADDSLNVQGAYLEVLWDTLGSMGVIAAAVVVATTGWTYVDPLIGAAIAVGVAPRIWHLAGQAVRVLIQAAPPELDLQAMRADLAALAGVVDVHDLHVWTLTSDMEVASAHLMVRGQADAHAVLDRARDLLRDRYHVVHATLQVEPDDHKGCEELSW